jgi:hypothetical protein
MVSGMVLYFDSKRVLKWEMPFYADILANTLLIEPKHLMSVSSASQPYSLSPYVRFQVLVVASMKFKAFWDISVV